MKKILIAAIAGFSLSALLPFAASAHLAGGEDVQEGGYIIDFGYDPVTLREREPATIAFNLVHADDGDVALPEGVWVRISKGNEIILSGVFKPQPANVTFGYEFPSAGEYEVKARFDGVPGGPVERTFPVTVAAQAAASDKEPVSSGPGRGATAGLIAALATLEICLYFGYARSHNDKS